MPAKPEGIAQSNLYFALLGFVKGEVKFRIQSLIIGKVVDGGGYYGLIDGQEAGNTFDGPRSPQQVACHGFG